MMKKTKEIVLYVVWLCLYILCVGLGVMASAAEGFGKVMMVLTALIFYVPGICLLVMGLKDEDKKLLLRLRLVCIVSLVLTLAALVGYFMTGNNTMFELLAIVSAPMLCGQYWALSLFCWAALMMATIPGVIIPRGKK